MPSSFRREARLGPRHQITIINNIMKILVTGAAGFIGAAVLNRLLKERHDIVGIDNFSNYYDPSMKFARLDQLGISGRDIPSETPVASSIYPRLTFIKTDLEDSEATDRLFEGNCFDIVIHLAGQPGVRHSISNPRSYISNNIDVFVNILEGCRNHAIKHLVFASSSSVYGLNAKVPFSENDSIAHPVSLYAATKKSNELMAHVYSQLYNLPVTGLRFFTVYGPWGRPDMSPHLFIDAILHDRPIKVFNNGDMLRDFTYIDDIAESVARIAGIIPQRDDKWDALSADPSTSCAPYRIYNVGCQHPIRLIDYVSCIESAIGKEAKKIFLPMQPGDVYQTNSDSSALASVTGFSPSTPLEEGIKKTVEWFKSYYKT